MSKKDSLNKVYKIIIDDLKKEWKTPKIDEEWIGELLNSVRENSEEQSHLWGYADWAPSEDEVKEKLKELTETIIETRERVERTEIRNRRLYTEISRIFVETKKLKDELEESKKEISTSKKEIENLAKRTERVNNLVIGCLIAFFIAFLVRLFDDISFRYGVTEEWNQKIIEDQSTIWNFNEKLRYFENYINNNIDGIKQNMDDNIKNKVESEINQFMLDFYREKVSENEKRK